MNLDLILSEIDRNIDGSIDRLCALLRIPSISTDPKYQTACNNAAVHLVDMLTSLGFEASLRKTDGHPMVVAHAGETQPRVLFYGHYDVQPVDPISLWKTDPFEPVLESTSGGPVIRGRGASDDKGQLMTFIEACRAWRAVEGKLPESVSILLEGEEECGSPSLVPFLEQHRKELRADLALICDTGLFGSTTPAIVTQLRGLLAEEPILTGPSIDLHSGMYGGAAANPIREMSRILAGLHDDSGRVTISGFYDGVLDIPQSLKNQWNSLAFDCETFLGEVGLAIPAGEENYPPLELLWSRPTCEFNGIQGGYAGDGFKTVIPSSASTKVSFRLVGTQDPLAIRQEFREYVRKELPEDVSVEFVDHGASKASQMPTDHPLFTLARKALTEEWKKEAVYVGCGGSIPIATFFQDILGMNSLLTGFARDDDNIHSPNEKYDVQSFHKGIRSWARILAELETKL